MPPAMAEGDSARIIYIVPSEVGSIVTVPPKRTVFLPDAILVTIAGNSVLRVR